jgi:hypothetical protein
MRLSSHKPAAHAAQLFWLALLNFAVLARLPRMARLVRLIQQQREFCGFQGASNLIVDLIIKSASSPRIFTGMYNICKYPPSSKLSFFSALDNSQLFTIIGIMLSAEVLVQ